MDAPNLEPVWVREDVVRAIHLRQLSEHGGLPGIRDENLLKSALARPQNLLAYGEPPPDLADLAAAYAFGLARNHAFVDGNKRVSLVVCRTFLVLNGIDIQASQEEKYLTWWRLAAGELTEQQLADWLRQKQVHRNSDTLTPVNVGVSHEELDARLPPMECAQLAAAFAPRSAGYPCTKVGANKSEQNVPSKVQSPRPDLFALPLLRQDGG